MEPGSSPDRGGSAVRERGGDGADDLVLVDNASNAINILLARLGLSPTPLNATAPLDQAPGVLLALSVSSRSTVTTYH